MQITLQRATLSCCWIEDWNLYASQSLINRFPSKEFQRHQSGISADFLPSRCQVIHGKVDSLEIEKKFDTNQTTALNVYFKFHLTTTVLTRRSALKRRLCAFKSKINNEESFLYVLKVQPEPYIRNHDCLLLVLSFFLSQIVLFHILFIGSGKCSQWRQRFL